MDTRQKLRDLAISDSGFVFDPYTGATFSANGSGRVILEGLREGLDRAAICARLVENFDVAGEDLPRDIADFLQVLRREGVVELDFDPDSGAGR